MTTQAKTPVGAASLPYPGPWARIPVLYEDEDEGDMGESHPHVITGEILRVCIEAHLADQPRYQVFANMNLYYLAGPPHPQSGSAPYVSPDVMVVEPFTRLPEDVRSYTIGRDGPPPLVTVEVLSQSSAQKRDLKEKIEVYARIGVPEYILADPTGEFLPERLLLKRLQADGTYKDERDSDGGVTSVLGFRVIIDETGQVRVLNLKTNHAYVRPREAEVVARAAREAQASAQAEAQARRLAEERARAEAETRRLAEERAQAEAEARRLAEERAQAEAEARRLAEERAQAEAEARQLAEEQAKAEANTRQREAEARTLAEKRIRELEEEITRVRGTGKDQP
jgi:Uma2 family endonuclease